MSYERLTDKNWRRRAYQFDDIYKRLAEMEDKIENGTLLYKICKDGDEVYIIAKQGLDIYSVEKVMIVDFWYSKQDKCLYAIDSDGALHREVYATEQEAEEKLRELRGEKE